MSNRPSTHLGPVLLTCLICSCSGNASGVEWYLGHHQDTFALLRPGQDDRLRSTGLTSLGLYMGLDSAPVSLSVDGLWINRDDPFTPLAGDFNGLSNIAGDESMRLYRAAVHHGRMEDKVSWSAGLLVMDDDFLVMDEAATLINSAFGVTATLTGNTFIPTYPLSAPGAVLRFNPGDTGSYTRAGIYDGNTGTEQYNPHGTRLGVDNDAGLALLLETGRWLSFSGHDESVVKLGGWLHSGRFRKLDGSGNNRFNGNLYGLVEGQFTRGQHRYGYFARLAWSPSLSYNTVVMEFETGINRYFARQDKKPDVLSLGFVYTDFSIASVEVETGTGISPARDHEMVVELAYSFSITRWLSLQPDIQWIHNARNGNRNTWLTGFRLSISF